MEGTYLPASDFYTGAGTKMISGAGTLSLSTRARARALFSLSLYRYPYNIPHPQFIVMSHFISVGLAIYRELACAPTENHIMLCLLSLSLLLPSLRPSRPPSLAGADHAWTGLSVDATNLGGIPGTGPGNQFTCFTSKKVQILTQKALPSQRAPLRVGVGPLRGPLDVPEALLAAATSCAAGNRSCR
jgi:hypothetical protein